MPLTWWLMHRVCCIAVLGVRPLNRAKELFPPDARGECAHPRSPSRPVHAPWLVAESLQHLLPSSQLPVCPPCHPLALTGPLVMISGPLSNSRQSLHPNPFAEPFPHAQRPAVSGRGRIVLPTHRGSGGQATAPSAPAPLNPKQTRTVQPGISQSLTALRVVPSDRRGPGDPMLCRMPRREARGTRNSESP